jgi:hypothetical protein
LLKKGKNNVLTESDVWGLGEKFSCEGEHVVRLKERWNNELKQEKPSFLRAIVKAYQHELIVQGI